MNCTVAGVALAEFIDALGGDKKIWATVFESSSHKIFGIQVDVLRGMDGPGLSRVFRAAKEKNLPASGKAPVQGRWQDELLTQHARRCRSF